MKNRGLSQESLKLIACVTMLLDHIGAVIVIDLFYQSRSEALLDVYNGLRMVGRLAFPIYCFLLAEGVYFTRNPARYGLRLLIGAVLAEVPFDLAIFGSITWAHQSVMVTLLLGFAMLEGMKRCPNLGTKLLAALLIALVANALNTDYGAKGICVIALFALTRELPYKRLWQFLGLWCIFSPGHLMAVNWLGGFSVTVQEWAVLSLIPISLYTGRKASESKALQWMFYLFYPVHLLVLCLIVRL